MAKAKKSSPAPASKASGTPVALAVPSIDPSSVAASAAKLVGAKLSPMSTSVAPAHAESAGFRNLKQNLHKPAGGPLGGLLDKTTPAGVKRPMPGGTFKQAGHHNQLVGHEASRTNVPRRTGGG